MDMRREGKHQQARDAWRKPRDWGSWVAARTEHAILWLYWAVSGYALRAWRALLVLLGVLLIATVLIAAVGFPPPRSETTLTGTVSGTPPQQTVRLEPVRDSSITTQQPFGARLGTATLIALEGAVFRASELQLTYKGRLIQTVVRFIGPVLLALALLSVRGRIKR
jgi:hypothetical protein